MGPSPGRIEAATDAVRLHRAWPRHEHSGPIPMSARERLPGRSRRCRGARCRAAGNGDREGRSLSGPRRARRTSTSREILFSGELRFASGRSSPRGASRAIPHCHIRHRPPPASPRGIIGTWNDDARGGPASHASTRGGGQLQHCGQKWIFAPHTPLLLHARSRRITSDAPTSNRAAAGRTERDARVRSLPLQPTSRRPISGVSARSGSESRPLNQRRRSHNA